MAPESSAKAGQARFQHFRRNDNVIYKHPPELTYSSLRAKNTILNFPPSSLMEVDGTSSKTPA